MNILKKIHLAFVFLAGLFPTEMVYADDSFVVVVASDTVIAMPDSQFYAQSLKVHFPVGNFSIPREASLLADLDSRLKPYLQDDSYRLRSILLRGAASPEGPIPLNHRLGRRRAQALLDIVNRYVGGAGHSLRQEIVPEDYAFLLMLMRQEGDPDYQRVADLVRQYQDEDPARLKAELMRLDGRQVWNRLVATYFKRLRAAGVVFVFSKVRPADADSLDIRLLWPMAELSATPVLSPVELPALPPLAMPVRVPRREMLSVKTNLLLDFAYVPGYNRFCPIPNVAVEYYPLHGHFTYGASFDSPWWQDYDDHKYFQVRNYQLEARYYLRSGDVNRTGYGNGIAFRGLYLQGYVHAGLYGISFSSHRAWVGEGAGGGVGLGYVMPLGRKSRWRLELGVQLGVMFTRYDPFQYESLLFADLHDNLYYYKWYNWGHLFKKRRHNYTWIGPTRVGVTLSYDLLFRRRARKGVSLKRYETQ